MTENRSGQDIGKSRDYVPVIGLRFSSLARSLDASCHSLVNVFGGGAATMDYTKIKRKVGMSKNQNNFVFQRRTKRVQGEVQDTTQTYESNSRKEDFKSFARCTRRCTGTMRSKSHVVSY